MPDKLTKLTALHVTRVAFVPKGDNPGAHVPLWKAAPDLGDRLATALQNMNLNGSGTESEKAGGREEGHVDEPTRKDLPDDLPEKVTQYLDATEKSLGEAATENERLTKELAEAKAAADAKVEKVETDGDVDPIAKAIDGETDPVRKAALVELQKRDAEREAQAKIDRDLTKAAQDTADRLRVEKADDQAIAKVAGWKHLPFKAEEVGPAFRKLREADADLADEIEKVLDRTNAIASEALKEFGAGDAVAGGEPLDKLNAMAKARAEKSDGKLTEAMAFDEVVQSTEGRALYAEYQAAREEANR